MHSVSLQPVFMLVKDSSALLKLQLNKVKQLFCLT